MSLAIVTLVLQLLSPMLAAENAISTSVINLDAARSAFAEARALCSADDGKLWGVSLCGPMLFADAQTHEAVANTAFPGSVQRANLFAGKLPDTIQVSNTSVEFAGMRWTMVSWPLPANSQSLAVLLMHESYHRIQPQLGLVASGGLGENGHLDTEQGRIWLRGELHALSAALLAQGEARTQALRDALAMRAYRQMLFPDAADQERGVELNESLAESTGIDVGLAPSERIAYAVRDIKKVEDAPTYVREFPYATGGAYAELMDAVKPDWRRAVTPASDLAHLAAATYGVTVTAPSGPEVQHIISGYDGAMIVAQESARAAKAAEANRRYTAEFITGPTLTLPLRHMSIQFNPQEIEQFRNYGSIYHTVEIQDDWGKLVVTGGDALISKNFDQIIVAAPQPKSDATIVGTNWMVSLTPGFAAIEDPDHPKSFVIPSGHKPQ